MQTQLHRKHFDIAVRGHNSCWVLIIYGFEIHFGMFALGTTHALEFSKVPLAHTWIGTKILTICRA